MITSQRLEKFLALLLMAILLVACGSQAVASESHTSVENHSELTETVDLEFTLKTLMIDGKLAYIGIGSDIDAVINPDLIVQPGAVVRLVILNGDGMPHDLFLPDFGIKTSFVNKIGDSAEVILKVGDSQPGTYVYYCTVPGHRQAGQEGRLIVAGP